jgi:magnesium-transporting ATPase (P-type)
MVFKNIWVEGTEYSAEGMFEEKSRLLKDSDFVRFWTAAVLCHEVVAEVCFLEYARSLGFIFRKRTKKYVKIKVFNKKKLYKLLLVLPFGDRKMMTVVVRDIETQCIVVLTKGADNAVLAAASSQ